MSIQLDDLVYDYPDIEQPEFQQKITSKYEFAELSSSIDEEIPKAGEYYNHQKFIHRYLSQYDRLLLIHGPGTGKTLSSGGKSEEIRKNLTINATLGYVEKYLRPTRSNIKQCIIFAKGTHVQEEFKNQLINQCTGTGQNIEEVLSSFKKFYMFTTSVKFANNISSKTDEEIIEEYSDSIIIRDEIHGSRIDASESNKEKFGIGEDKNDKQRRQASVYKIIKRFLHLIKRSIVIASSATPMINEPWEIMDIVNPLLPLNKQMNFSIADFNSRTIKELEPYFRGLISYVRETEIYAKPDYSSTIPIDENYEYKIIKSDNTSQIIKSKQKIYPLYMSLIPTNQDEKDYYLANNIETSPTIYYRTNKEGKEELILPQGNIYLMNASSIKLENSEMVINDNNIAKSKYQFYSNEREICNAIFPDGSYGTEGFKKFIKEINSPQDIYQPNDELLSWIKGSVRPGINLNTIDRTTIPFNEIYDISKLRYLSNKWAKIVEEINDQYYLKSDLKGNIYGYTHFLNGSGAIYLGVTLEANGIKRFEAETSVFGNDMTPSRSLCTPNPKTKRTPRYIKIPPGPRYAIIHSKVHADRYRAIMELFNSWENRHGEYIKFLIFTQVGRESFNLANCLTFIGIDKGWHNSDDYQARGRGLRQTSHENLRQEKLEEMRLKGINTDNFIIPVKILPLASLDPISNNSIDIKFFRLSEEKDIAIKSMMRILKIVSIDNIIHKNRNQRLLDEDGSPECDYSTCEYGSYDPIPNYIDYSSYDILYSDEAIENIITHISEIFKTSYQITLDQLINYFNNIIQHEKSQKLKNKYIVWYRPRLIEEALYKIIIDKISLQNRYGFKCYLVEDNGSFFIQNEYPVGLKIQYLHDYIYYSKHLIATTPISLADFSIQIEKINQGSVVSKITEKLDLNIPVSNEFKLDFESLGYINKINLVEIVIYKALIEGIKTPNIMYIAELYAKYIYTTNEPIGEIQAAAYLSKNSGMFNTGKPLTRISRTQKNITSNNLISVPKNANISPYGSPIFDINTVGEPVCFHNLYGHIKDNNAFSIKSKIFKGEGRIRLIKSKKGETWRDLAPYEIPVYNKLIQLSIDKIFSEYDKYPIYGYILQDNEFRIVNKFVESPLAAKDRRRERNGQIVNSMNKDVLTSIAYDLHININYNDDAVGNKSVMMQELQSDVRDIDKFDMNKLTYFYKIYKSGLSRNDLKNLIYEKLIELGRLLVY